MFQKAAGMRVVRWLGIVAAIVAMTVLAACKGGGSGNDQIVIVNIYTNPVVVTAGSIVELTASISAPGQDLSTLNRYWTISAGSLSDSDPDFTLTERGVAALENYSDDLLTTSSKVYWSVPATPGVTTITLDVEDQTKSINVTVGTSPVALSVTDGTEGRKVCTVQVNDIENLYQAAFRINYSSAWEPVSAVAGDFLGGNDDILWLGLTDKSGYVPCGITLRGDVDGVDGSGILGTVTFEPSSSTSAASEAAQLPFSVDMVQLFNRDGEMLSLD